MSRINVWYEHPPIPLRNFDYGAVFDGYDDGDLIGWGPTRTKAVEAGQISDDQAARMGVDEVALAGEVEA